MRSNFAISLIFILLFAIPLPAKEKRKWDPNVWQSSSPAVVDAEEAFRRDCRDLGKAISKWLRTQSDSDGAECDKLADKLMADHKERAEAYVIASELANLRGHTNRAIEIIKDVAVKFPDQRSSYANIPLPILAHFYTAAFAKQAGDMATARKEYETVLENIKNDKQNSITVVLCHLYIAEIDDAKTGKADAIKQRVGLIKQLEKPGFGLHDLAFDEFVRWAEYKLAKKTQGLEAARSKSKEPDEITDAIGEYITEPAGLTGGQLAISVYEDHSKLFGILAQRILNTESELDRHAVLFFGGYVCTRDGNYKRAEKYYNMLLEEDSFLAPSAGLGLVRCKKLQGKGAEADEIKNQLKQKYPLVDFEIHPSKSW